MTYRSVKIKFLRFELLKHTEQHVFVFCNLIFIFLWFYFFLLFRVAFIFFTFFANIDLNIFCNLLNDSSIDDTYFDFPKMNNLIDGYVSVFIWSRYFVFKIIHIRILLLFGWFSHSIYSPSDFLFLMNIC